MDLLAALAPALAQAQVSLLIPSDNPATDRPPKLRKRDLVELNVDSLAYGGRGVSTLPDGRIVFVQRGLPGDRVSASITKVKSSFVEAKTENVLQASPDRIPAKCPHTDDCGGCSWQELPYREQLRWKEQQFADSLGRIGGIDIEPEPIIGADDIWAYRNKMEFSFGDGPDGDLRLGLHRRGSYWQIVPLEYCHISPKRMNEVRSAVLQVAVDSGLPPYHNRRHEGFWRQLTIREAHNTGDLLVNIVTASGDLPREELLEALAPVGASTILWSITDQHSSTRIDSVETLTGDGFIEETLSTKRFRISPTSFFQTNTRMTEVLYKTIREAAEIKPTDKVLDLYCGTGSIGISLADKAREVFGIELVEESVEDARLNSRLNELENIEFACGATEAVLEEHHSSDGFDVVIVDPPRSGLHPKALKDVVSTRAPRIVYVSCNPTTLARDLAELVSAGYSAVRAVPLDLFPHTYHLEGVVTLDLVI